MSAFKKFSLWLVPLAFFSLLPMLLSAQEAGEKHSTSVTGCLKQGTDAGGYYLVAQDGKMYELTGNGASLAEHVGHTITVTGHTVKLPEAQESKKEASEKQESGGNSYVDFLAASVKMVSTSLPIILS